MCIPIFLRHRTGQHPATVFFLKTLHKTYPKAIYKVGPYYVIMNGVTKTAPFERPKIHIGTFRWAQIELYFDVIFPINILLLNGLVDGKS